MPISTNLPNAPLVFVLGVVRIGSYPNFDQKFENLHEALLGQFPEREDAGGYSFTGMSPAGRPEFTKNPMWRIYNRVTNSSLLLGNDQLVFEWPQYESLDHAMEDSLISIHSIFEKLPNVTPTLVGLRYINVLMDESPQPLVESVRSELLGFRHKGTEFVSSESSTAQKFDSGARLEVRFSCGHKQSGAALTPPGVGIPGVLRPNNKMQEFIKYDGQYGFIDIDAAVDVKPLENSPQDVLKLFRELREDMRPVLKDIVDEKTFRSWS